MSSIKKSNIIFYGEKKQERKKYTLKKEKERKYEKGEERKKACNRNQSLQKVQRLNSLKVEYTYFILCCKIQTKIYDNDLKLLLTPFATQL